MEILGGEELGCAQARSEEVVGSEEVVMRWWRGVREVVRNEGWLRRGEGCSVTGSIIICINMYCLINR